MLDKVSIIDAQNNQYVGEILSVSTKSNHVRISIQMPYTIINPTAIYLLDSQTQQGTSLGIPEGMDVIPAKIPYIFGFFLEEVVQV